MFLVQMKLFLKFMFEHILVDFLLHLRHSPFSKAQGRTFCPLPPTSLLQGPSGPLRGAPSHLLQNQGGRPQPPAPSGLLPDDRRGGRLGRVLLLKVNSTSALEPPDYCYNKINNATPFSSIQTPFPDLPRCPSHSLPSEHPLPWSGERTQELPVDINARMEQRRGPQGEAAPPLTPQPKEPAFSSSVSGPLSPQKRPGGEGGCLGTNRKDSPFSRGHSGTNV